jgi:vacuolar-type H+-ATPase subunit I/STV1
VLWVLSLLLGLASGSGLGRTLLGVLMSSVVGYVLLLAFGLLVARLERVRWPGMAKAILGFPIWLFSWSVINVVVLFYRDPTWYTVPHTDSLSLAESSALSSLERR